MAYVTLTEFKAWARESVADVDDDTEAELALAAAEASIDDHCGRTFNKVIGAGDSATARVYKARFGDLLTVHDLWTTTGLVVETRVTVTESWTAWLATDYQLEPLNGMNGPESGWPWYRIRAVDTKRFPVRQGLATVRVTAKWGWDAVPDKVKLATKLQASRYLLRRSSPHGLLEFTGDGTSVRVSPLDGDILRLVQPYVSTGRTLVGG